MMIPDEADGGSRRQDDLYGRPVAGTGKSGAPADSCVGLHASRKPQDCRLRPRPDQRFCQSTEKPRHGIIRPGFRNRAAYISLLSTSLPLPPFSRSRVDIALLFIRSVFGNNKSLTLPSLSYVIGILIHASRLIFNRHTPRHVSQ
jgi:hypothetical protein